MTLSTSGRNHVALAAICLAALMFGLEISSVPVILPVLEPKLHAGFKDMQWVMNAYTIACTTVLMATGTLADRYGRRRIFVISLIVFGVTSLLCGLAPSTPVLIAGRFLQGAGGGAMLICLIAILSHQFREGRERTRAFGLWGIIFGIGLGFGPIIGGAIVSVLGWQWVFLVHAPLALVALGLVALGVEESLNPEAGRLDLAGIATLSLTVLALVFYITQGPDLGFASTKALAILAVAIASAAAFVAIELRAVHPMFDFAVFRIRPFSGALFGSAGMNFSFWPFMVYLPTYFQTVLGYGVVAAGLSLLAYTLPTLLLPPLGERLAIRYSPRVVIPSGLFLIGAGFLAMVAGSGVAQASWLTMLPGCVLAGAGLGLTNTPVTNTTTGAVPAARAGMASGIDMSARLITLAINIALMGFILQWGIVARLRDLVPASLDAQLPTLAGRLAAGDLSVVAGALHLPASLLQGALAHGFGLAMLYGGLGVWVLAALSLATFGRPRRDAVAAQGTCVAPLR